MRRKKKDVAAPPVPPTELMKKSWFERLREWQRSRESRVAAEYDTVQLVVVGKKPTAWNGYEVRLSGLHPGSWGEVELECRQFFQEGDGQWISTKTLLDRAQEGEGFRGVTTALALKEYGKHLPVGWQGRRLYFLAHYLFDLDGKRHVFKLEYQKTGWVCAPVSLDDDNIWTRNDYFVCQRV